MINIVPGQTAYPPDGVLWVHQDGHFEGNALAPHGEANRGNVNIAGGTVDGIVYYVHMYIRRITAAGAVGRAYCELRIPATGEVIAHLDLYTNGVNDTVSLHAPIGAFIAAPQTLTMYTADASTGGTVDYRITVLAGRPSVPQF